MGSPRSSPTWTFRPRTGTRRTTSSPPTPGARLTRHEHELGAWSRARRAPDPRLAELLGRELLGYQHSVARFDSWLEPPRPELTLMVDLDGGLTADGQRLPDAWIGGLDDRPTIVGFGDTYGSIDLKLTPLGAYTLVGAPLSELAGRCVAIEDVFGAAGTELVRRLRAGYADQSHLNREFRELAGTTPTDFVRRLIPEGGVVGDPSH